MRIFDREANDQRTIIKAQVLAKGTLSSKEQITGLKVTDEPEFADLKITSLAAVIALGNTAKSVKSYLTKLWDKLSGLIATPVFTGELKAPSAQIGGATHNCQIETDGTIQLNGDATGFVDIFFPHGLPKTTGAGNPSLVTYLGNLRGYSYSVNDVHDFDPQEYYHQAVVGGDIVWHLHWLSQTNVAATRTVKFELERSWCSPSGVETLVTPNATVEVTIPANTPVNTHFLTNIVTDTIASIGPAWMLSARIKRIAASGTAPATDPILKALHGHVSLDTPAGSRGILSK